MLKATKVQSYFRRLSEIGIAPRDVLSATGIDSEDILQIKPKELNEISDLFDLLGGRTPASFAVYCGLNARVADFGIVGYGMLSAPTVREAFNCWRRFSLVAGHPMVATIEEKDDWWQFQMRPRCRMSARATRFCIDVSIAAFIPVLKELTGEPGHALRMAFPYAQGGDNSLYGELRSCNLHFNDTMATYTGKRTDLDRKVVTANTEVKEICDSQCQRLLNSITNKITLIDRIEKVLLSSDGRLPLLKEVAKLLGMSERTLQRELAEEGQTYQLVVSRFRRAYAMTLLHDGNHNVKTIAYLLGFEDPRSLRHAFHRWTGMSISDWGKQSCAESGDLSAGPPSRAYS